MAVVSFPAAAAGQQADGAGPDVAEAVDRYLDGVQAATTRAPAGPARRCPRLAPIQARTTPSQANKITRVCGC